MFSSLPQLLALFKYYKYFLIFPVAVFEGPIISVISGFLVSLGLLNGIATYIILVCGDLVGDSLYYSVGRYWGNLSWAKKIMRFTGYDEKMQQIVSDHFEKHKGKTLVLAKFSYGLGGTSQVMAGMVKVNYYQFLVWSVIGTMPKSLVLILIGFYAGSSYIKINIYLNSIEYVTLGIVAVLIIGYIILSKFAKKYFKGR